MADEEINQDAGCSNSVCTFSFKSVKRKPRQQRRRQSSSESEKASSEEESAVVRREKTVKINNPMKQHTSLKALKRTRTRSDSGSEGSDEDNDKITTSYKSKRLAKREGPADMGATATVEIDTDKGADAQASYERGLQINKDLKDKEDDKLYRGMTGYQQFIEKKDTVFGNAASGFNRKGPMRAPAHLRATVLWDYKPDICKDYKETGFCGFGDSCIFMHDRGDYKHGWQLEREELHGGGEDEDDDKYVIQSDDDELPFKCTICRETFKDPVVTKCKHYFCESCALENYKKSKRCFNCGQQTSGVFNPARDIMAKLKLYKEKAEIDNSDSDAEAPATAVEAD